METKANRQNVGFWRRLAAYVLDLIPIFIVVFGIAYYFFGFDTTLMHYFDEQRSDAERLAFLRERNVIRDTMLVVWVLYSALMESSPWQGTHGKWLLGIKVERVEGGRIGPLQALKRAAMKMIGALPLYLGYLWAVFNKEKAAWHDLCAKTRVVKR